MLTINRQSLHLCRTLARRAGVKPLSKDQSPQIVIQSDPLGSRLITATQDVRLEFAWQQSAAENCSCPLARELLDECGSKQSDPVTLTANGSQHVQAHWTNKGIPQAKSFAVFPSQNCRPCFAA